MKKYILNAVTNYIEDVGGSRRPVANTYDSYENRDPYSRVTPSGPSANRGAPTSRGGSTYGSTPYSSNAYEEVVSTYKLYFLVV